MSVESLRVYRYDPVDYRRDKYYAIFDFQWITPAGEPAGFRTEVLRKFTIKGSIHTIRKSPFGLLVLIATCPDPGGGDFRFRAELRTGGRVYELPIIDGDRDDVCRDEPCGKPEHWVLA